MTEEGNGGPRNDNLQEVLLRSVNQVMRTQILIIAALLLLPLALSLDCTTVKQVNCGAAGSCQYYVWTNGTCTAITDCSKTSVVTVWSNSSQSCVPCAQSNSAFCTSNCQSKGFYYNIYQLICTTCANTYGSACLTCNSTRCQTCNDGFLLASGGQSCLKIGCNVPFCSTCSATSSSICTACESSVFTLYQGLCYCNIANCQLCSSGTCLSCFSGYSLDPSKTKCNVNCISNCDVCSNRNSCTVCSSGYVYDSSVRQCKIDCSGITNCNSCTSPYVCTGCITGYRPNLSGTACNVRCTDSKCITCITPNSCSMCATGYIAKLNSNTNLYSCTRDVCQIPFCTSCTSSTTCSACSNLFSLAPGGSSCVPSCSISYCAVCATATSCLTCYDGYKISSGSCEPICSISNCQLCQTAATCLKCSDGFVLSANRQICGYNCGIQGCTTCRSSTACSLCGSGLTLSDDEKTCIVNCQRGFYLDSASNTCTACTTSRCLSCDSTNRCATCQSFFYLDTDFTCKACRTIANCFYCDQGSATCTNCNSGYSLVDGECVSQASCKAANCLTCVSGSTSACQTCNEGYQVSGTSCVVMSCPGNQVLSGSTCTCGQKSYLYAGQCTSCSDINCLSCSSSSCNSCAYGFYPSGTACVACEDPNCQACDSTRCTDCHNGYFKKNGVCVATPTEKVSSVSRFGKVITCPPGCSACDIDKFDNLVCLQATDGYIILSGFIYQCSSTCLTCAAVLDDSGLASFCYSCPTGFALSFGTCIKCTDVNAITCRNTDATYSTSCDVGYTTMNATSGQATGVCSACADNCLKCNVAGAGNCDNGGCFSTAIQKPDGCLLCFKGCFKCKGDPNTCLQCSKYYFLASDSTCKSCSSNCVTCINATNCTNCQVGTYLLNNQCVSPPSILNCVGFDTALTTCTACDFGYNLANGACQLNWACNGTSSCTSCPDGYYLSSKVCPPCPVLPNCKSCRMHKSDHCADCVDGYYSKAGTCTACGITGAAACKSAHFTTKAKDGYYLVVNIANAKTGAVAACEGNCATCVHSEINCVTCKPGSSLSGTECVSDSYKTITIVLFIKSLGSTPNVDPDYETSSCFNFLSGYYGSLGRAFGFRNRRQCQRKLRMRRLWKGSANLEMNMDGDTTVDPLVAINSVNDDNFGVVGVSVVSSSIQQQSSTNLGLILGVSIPLGVLLVIIVILIKVQGGEDDERMKSVDETEKEVQDIEAI